MYYAQVWALTLFVAEGQGGKYRPGFERLVRECADGKAFATLSKSVGAKAAQSSFLRRRGTEVITTYFNTDLAAFDAEYQAFVRGITAVGAKERIVQGQNPIQ